MNTWKNSSQRPSTQKPEAAAFLPQPFLSLPWAPSLQSWPSAHVLSVLTLQGPLGLPTASSYFPSSVQCPPTGGGAPLPLAPTPGLWLKPPALSVLGPPRPHRVCGVFASPSYNLTLVFLSDNLYPFLFHPLNPLSSVITTIHSTAVV